MKRLPTAALAFALLAGLAGAARGMENAKTLGLAGDGVADDGAALAKRLTEGVREIYFPAGVYRLGPVELPADTQLSFSPGAKLVPIAEQVVYQKEIADAAGKTRKATAKKPLFHVVGDNVRLQGLHFDFTDGLPKDNPRLVEVLVQADGVAGPTVSGFAVKAGQPKAEPERRLPALYLLRANRCRDVVLENSGAEDITHMAWTTRCRNVTSRGNRMVNGAAMTTFHAGGENLRHHDNWSRGVGYQCVWRGGSPDPSRKAPKVPLGTASRVVRGVAEGEDGYVPHTDGAFDIAVANNYAEYGTVLCWGNKGRQTVISGNIARFMWDYSYGSEGGENLVVANNISVNSAVAGFMMMYYTENVSITGNLVLVRHEPDFDPKLAGGRPASTYFGQFVRLHHGPPNAEDRYGAGTVDIGGNLFVNELADRPSSISIEAGRDVRIANNKFVNGFVRMNDEVQFVTDPKQLKLDADEFAAMKSAAGQKDEPILTLRRVGADRVRLTVSGNEFISRRAGDPPAILVDGTAATTIVRDNVIRKEETFRTYTPEQLAMEKGLPRFMLFSETVYGKRDTACREPAVAIGIMPFAGGEAIVQNNTVLGWGKSLRLANPSPDAKARFLAAGNLLDGATETAGDPARTEWTIRDPATPGAAPVK